LITLRQLVKFKSKNRDDGVYIVREIRYNGKALIESTEDKSYYIIDLDDIEGVKNDQD